DLLDVSRITTGRVELRKTRVELGAIVTQSVDAVKPQLDAKGHVLELHLDPGGRIVLTTRREGGQAVVSVKDNGIGFAPEMAPRLFTLFAQAENAAHRDGGGLGIGLALVREFVERHGGTVQARSDGPLLGSEFTVRLPCET